MLHPPPTGHTQPFAPSPTPLYPILATTDAVPPTPTLHSSTSTHKHTNPTRFTYTNTHKYTRPTTMPSASINPTTARHQRSLGHLMTPSPHNVRSPATPATSFLYSYP
ncbi:hypothetical protein E2C01_074535 [Portunus trituberculatus]|uniref:Uncharacterized protein n=1 Tax=Portunus trituberculatus TaxID=210409 RepID=A0A5B7ICQ3_PORTR|nr:hypothetical protein [Portunus trituberculatus]